MINEKIQNVLFDMTELKRVSDINFSSPSLEPPNKADFPRVLDKEINRSDKVSVKREPKSAAPETPKRKDRANTELESSNKRKNKDESLPVSGKRLPKKEADQELPNKESGGAQEASGAEEDQGVEKTSLIAAEISGEVLSLEALLNSEETKVVELEQASTFDEVIEVLAPAQISTGSDENTEMEVSDLERLDVIDKEVVVRQKLDDSEMPVVALKETGQVDQVDKADQDKESKQSVVFSSEVQVLANKETRVTSESKSTETAQQRELANSESGQLIEGVKSNKQSKDENLVGREFSNEQPNRIVEADEKEQATDSDLNEDNNPLRQHISKLSIIQQSATEDEFKSRYEMKKGVAESDLTIHSAQGLSREQISQLNEFRKMDGVVSATRIATPVAEPGWGNKMVERIMWMMSQNIHSAKIHLEPPQLGPLDVKISMSADQANVTFTTNFGGVRDSVEQSIARLKEMFEQSGLGNVDVDVRDQQQKENEQKGGKSSKQSDSEDDFFGDLEGELLPDRVMSTEGGLALVDFYA